MRRHPVTGQIAHGIAGDGVYVDGAPIAPGGGENGMPDWLDADPIWCGSSGKPFAFVRGSQVGAWAGWTSLGGVVTSWGLKLPAAVLLDMAPDGTLLVGDNYQSGQGISAYRAGATTPLWRVSAARPEMRFPYAQAAILDDKTACWTENQGGRMVLVGYGLTAGPRPPWTVLHPRLFRVNGAIWVVYLRAEDDRTIAHPWNYVWLGFSVPGFGYGPEAWQEGEFLTIAWSVGAGERATDIKGQTFNLAALEAIPSLPVARPIGALGPSLPNGTDVDFVSFLLRNGAPDARCWPRGDKSRGDTHGADMQVVTPADLRPNNAGLLSDPATQIVIWSAVFDRDGQGECGGVMSIDRDPDGGVHHHADANNSRIPENIPSPVGKGPFVDTWTKTLWAKKKWKIGREHGFTLDCQLQQWHPKTGALLRTIDFQKEMWIEAVQPWYGGADAGEGVCLTAVYDNTGSGVVRHPELHVERDRYFVGNDGRVWGRVSWDSNQSDVVFNTDGTYQFPLPERSKSISNFYHLGGQRFPVRLPNCPMPRVASEVPTVSERTMNAAEKSVVLAYAAANPLPQGDGSEAFLDRAYRKLPDGWLAKLCQQLRFSLGENYGHKRRNSGASLSAGTFAVKDGDVMHCFDILIGAGTGTPRLDVNVDSQVVHWRSDDPGVEVQEFVSVLPVNHLAAAKPTPGRALLASRVWGVDAFDLAPRTIGLKDFRYLEQVLVQNQLVSRQFMYATPMNAPRIQRDAATGLAQMAALLPHMRARKARGSVFTILCGTRNDGWSWQQALDYCRQCNALFLQFPELVVGIDLFNENLQSFEQDYAVNPQFLKEAEACFDLRFPVSPGAAWGDQPPLRAAGSYLVAHGDRELRPRAAAKLMKVEGWQTLDREGMGITEVGRTAGRQRVADPGWADEQISAVEEYDLAGSIAHFDAGMSCDVGELGPVQNAVIALYAAKARGAQPVPVPTAHPILDFPLAPYPYPFWMEHHAAIEAECSAWLKRVQGVPMIPKQWWHIEYRILNEFDRWKTVRGALANTWPGGDPK